MMVDTGGCNKMVLTPEQLEEKKAQVEANLLTWITIHGNLCLALRHPQNRGPSRVYAVAFVKEIGRMLVEHGAITEEQLRKIEKLEAEEGSPDIEGFF